MRVCHHHRRFYRPRRVRRRVQGAVEAAVAQAGGAHAHGAPPYEWRGDDGDACGLNATTRRWARRGPGARGRPGASYRSGGRGLLARHRRPDQWTGCPLEGKATGHGHPAVLVAACAVRSWPLRMWQLPASTRRCPCPVLPSQHRNRGRFLRLRCGCGCGCG